MTTSAGSLEQTTALQDSLRILRLASPLALIQLAQVAISTTDLIVLGASSTTALAAGALGFAIFNLIRTMGFGVLVGTSNLVARTGDQFAEIFWAAGLTATCNAVIAMGCVAVLGWNLSAFNNDPAVIEQTRHYLWAIAPGYLPLFAFYVCRGVLVGHEKANGLLMVTLCVVALNGFLDVGFMFGRFGLPELGVFGVALSSTLCFLFQAVVTIGLVFRGARYWPVPKSNVITHVPPLLKIGLPTAATYGSEAGFTVVLTIFAGWLGTNALAAHAVLNQLVYVAFMLSVGMSHATSVLISGAGDDTQRRRFGLTGISLGGLIAFVFAILFLLVPNPLAQIFLGDDLSALNVVLLVMPIAALLVPLDFTQNIAIGAVRAVDRAGTGFTLTATIYWVLGVPLAWLLAFPMEIGLSGVWLGNGVGLLGASVALLVLFLRQTGPQDG
uniref:RC201 n=1 Tax=Ruegeria sp. PR1b TaxID=185588 RepID=Q8KVY9_9RHOB|nr:MATE family efflux transporter [Ruegeria sp. PR1b]AAN05274.1 RC201 [Ruegeria sp. PR1b]